MDQTAKNAALRKRELQDMVDDHARLGYQDGQIRAHLREKHGVLPTEVIPPPTKAAQRARERFFATGIVDDAGMKMSTIIRPSEQTSRQALVDDRAPLPSLDLSQEWLQKIMDDVADKQDISPPPVQITELRERTWRDSDVAFFSTVYRGTGPTLLDRMIHGFAVIYRELGFKSGSNFEVFRERIASKAGKKKFDPAMLSGDLLKDWNIHKAIDVSLYPWFKDGCETANIQIDAEMAEIFLAGKAPISNSWLKDFLAKPVYIDIREKTCGQRTISGIFCRPAPTQGTFSYMAVVEWIGQGYEAFIFGEYGKPKQAVLMYPGDADDEGMTGEAIDAIYDPITLQVEKIVSMAYMYCRTKMGVGPSLNSLTSMPRGIGASSNEKKERNKEKTHSYFRVLRLEVPPDRFGFTGRIGKSWSLDHLVSVTGHFRWQPYGSGKNLRKLIWIDAYEKGQGVRHRPADNPVLLHVPTLEQPSVDASQDGG